MSLIGVKHGEDNCERVSGNVGLRLRSVGRECRTAFDTVRVGARGRGAASVTRAGGVFLAATLALLLALSPTVALSQVTGGTTTGNDPADTGGGGGHDTEDNPLWESVAKFVDASVGNFNAWLNKMSNGWQDIQNGFWGSWGGSFDDGNEPEPEPEHGVTEIAKSYVLDRTYFFNGSAAPTPADDKFNVTNVSLNDTMAARLESLRSQYPYMLVYADYSKSYNKGSAYVCLSANPWRLGNPDAGEAKVFYTSGEDFKYIYSDSKTYGSTTDIAITSGTINTQSKDSNTGVLRKFVPNNYSAMYRIFGSNNPSGGNPAENPTSGGGSDTGGGGDDSGGDGGSSVVGTDPYGYDANEYTTTTVYNDLDLDLSPITKRLDSMAITNNQIGKDLNKLVYGIDGDLLRIFQAILLDVSTNKSNGITFQKILDELTDGYLKDIAADIDLIAKELTNLQSNYAMRSIKGFLYAIYQELDEWPKGATSGGGSSDPVTVDLSTIESKLDTIISKMGQGDGGDTVINNDNDQTLGEQIGEKMNEVKERFPFSIPWDVMYILGLVRAEPIAPQFDLPVIGSDEDIHVDLSQWEPVAVVTRNGTLVLFGLGLALRSRNLIRTWGGSDD